MMAFLADIYTVCRQKQSEEVRIAVEEELSTNAHNHVHYGKTQVWPVALSVFGIPWT